MQCYQQVLVANSSESIDSNGLNPLFILVFGASKAIDRQPALQTLKEKLPEVLLTGCSTAEEVAGEQVNDDSLVITYVAFEKTKVVGHTEQTENAENSAEAGEVLLAKFDQKDLKHVFVLSEGLNVNGTSLVKGMRKTQRRK
mgnify:CR=1 FL=1